MSTPGVARLDDGSEITIRASIGGINEVVTTPAGVFVAVRDQVSVSAQSPDDLRKLVAQKPVIRLEEDVKQLEKWKRVTLVDTKAAVELIEFVGTDKMKYHVKLEITPNIISRTMEYRDEYGNPAYYVRWNECMTTSIME